MIKFFVFGLPHFEQDGQDLNFRRSKCLALMAYLVATRRPQSRAVLAELLWPELSLEASRRNFRRELSRLKKLLGEEVLLADRSQVTFNPETAIEIDLYSFWNMSRMLSNAGQRLDAELVSLIETTLTVYKDDFLAGFAVHGSAEFDDWRYFEAESIRRAYASSLQSLIAWFSQNQNYPKAIHYARLWLALDPLHEIAQRELMSLLAYAGDYTDALRQYQSYERLLREDLDILPEAETTRLYEAIRTRQFPAPQAAASTKQLSLPHNLPSQMTSFVGREKELAEIQRLLQNHHSRLLTIVAIGGMGKTRLALELAQNYLENYQNPEMQQEKALTGIYFIDLSPLSDAANIAQTTANTLACVIQADGRSIRQQVLDYLRDKSLLLIFDNYEHLLADALFVSEICQSAPHIHIIVTSREALNLQEETVFRVSGMDIPDLKASENWLSFSAVELFLNSARRLQRGFALEEQDKEAILKICHNVGGMPLGILLATGWLDTLTIKELADEIEQSLDFLSTDARNLASRHRNIRAVFEPSWQRLEPLERDVFMQLSVFRGGFTAQAAQRIIGASLPQLAKLLKKSLIQRDMATGRYSIHELLRQYAQEHLEASGKAKAVHTAHSVYYLDWIASLEQDIKGRRQLAALDEIELDLDNLRSAWSWASQQRDFAMLNHSLNSFYYFADMHSHHHEFRQRWGDTLNQLGEVEAEDEVYTKGRIRFRCIKFDYNNLLTKELGIYIYSQIPETGQELDLSSLLGWFGTDLNYFETHFRLTHKRNDKAEMAFYLEQKSALSGFLVDTKDAIALHIEAINYYRELEDKFHLADSLNALAYIIFYDKNFSDDESKRLEQAMNYLHESLQLQYEIGDGHGRIWSFNAYAAISSGLGKFEEAIHYLEEMQNLANLYKNPFALARTYEILSEAYFFVGNFSASRLNLNRQSELLMRTGYSIFEGRMQLIHWLLDAVESERYADAPAQVEQQLYIGDLQHFLQAIVSCGLADFEKAKHELVLLLKAQLIQNDKSDFWRWGLAGVIMANSGYPLEGLEIIAFTMTQTQAHVGWMEQWPLIKRLLTKLEADLGQELYKTHWENGKSLDKEAVIQKITIWIEAES